MSVSVCRPTCQSDCQLACLSLCQLTYLSVSLRVSLTVWQPICLSLFICLPLLPVCLSACQPNFLCTPVCLLSCLPRGLSLCPSVCPPACLPVTPRRLLAICISRCSACTYGVVSGDESRDWLRMSAMLQGFAGLEVKRLRVTGMTDSCNSRSSWLRTNRVSAVFLHNKNSNIAH